MGPYQLQPPRPTRPLSPESQVPLPDPSDWSKLSPFVNGREAGFRLAIPSTPASQTSMSVDWMASDKVPVSSEHCDSGHADHGEELPWVECAPGSTEMATASAHPRNRENISTEAASSPVVPLEAPGFPSKRKGRISYSRSLPRPSSYDDPYLHLSGPTFHSDDPYRSESRGGAEELKGLGSIEEVPTSQNMYTTLPLPNTSEGGPLPLYEEAVARRLRSRESQEGWNNMSVNAKNMTGLRIADTARGVTTKPNVVEPQQVPSAANSEANPTTFYGTAPAPEKDDSERPGTSWLKSTVSLPPGFVLSRSTDFFLNLLGYEEEVRRDMLGTSSAFSNCRVDQGDNAQKTRSWSGTGLKPLPTRASTGSRPHTTSEIGVQAPGDRIDKDNVSRERMGALKLKVLEQINSSSNEPTLSGFRVSSRTVPYLDKFETEQPVFQCARNSCSNSIETDAVAVRLLPRRPEQTTEWHSASSWLSTESDLFVFPNAFEESARPLWSKICGLIRKAFLRIKRFRRLMRGFPRQTGSQSTRGAHTVRFEARYSSDRKSFNFLEG